MIKIFSALSLEELEKKVNRFEEQHKTDYKFREHSLSSDNGQYLMSIVMIPRYKYFA